MIILRAGQRILPARLKFKQRSDSVQMYILLTCKNNPAASAAQITHLVSRSDRHLRNSNQKH